MGQNQILSLQIWHILNYICKQDTVFLVLSLQIS